MKILSVAQARAIDVDAVERLKMPTILLMENAARGVAEVARTLGSRFVVLCGPGNNGGDGLAAVRHLLPAASAFLLAEPDPARAPDAALQLRILKAAGVPLPVGLPMGETLVALQQDPELVWIDALFGTGLQRPLAGAALQFVAAFNDARGKKLCVDIPSGLHGDDGIVLGDACRATVTVTFEARKRGLVQPSAAPFVGQVVVVPLGLPKLS